MKRYHIIKPEFYGQFSCKGGDCRYNCCQGWNITLSKEEYRRIKANTDAWPEKGNQKYFQKMPPEYRKRNEESLIILNEKHECPFLSENRLCQLQCEFGADILPATCIKYPRSNHMYPEDTFMTLSPGCERVLELCFQEKKIRLVEEEKLLDSLPSSSRITKNMIARHPVLQYHNDILSLCLVLLQAEDTTMENRILLLGIAVRHIDQLVKDGKHSEIGKYIGNYIKILETTEDIEDLLPQPETNPLVLMHNLNIAQRRQALNDKEHDGMLNSIHEALHLTVIQNSSEGTISFSSERYHSLKEKYLNFQSGREHFMENLMVTFLLYMNLPFCSSISASIWDNYMYLAWTYSIVKLCLTACMDMIRTEQDFIHYCSILMRSWAHNHIFGKKIIENFQLNKSDTLAHIATLLYS